MVSREYIVCSDKFDVVCNGMQLIKIMKIYIRAASLSETLLTEYTSPKRPQTKYSKVPLV
jgi:hypothetical protein